jgi:glycosyltransferase involved in cell wall biosynthesis
MNRICFAALYAYPLFNPAISHIFGGAEVRAWLFGVGLSKFSDNEVSFIVLNHGQPQVEHYGLIKVYRHSHYRSSPSFNERLMGRVQDLIYRLQHPSTPSLRINHYEVTPTKFIIYEKVDADLYCTFGVSNFSAELAAFCRRHKKRFALFSSNDDDFSLDYYPDSRRKNAYGSIGSLCYYSIMQADLIVTQTQIQTELLKKRFGRTSATVFSPIELTPTEKIGSSLPEGRCVALWIGKSNRIKRPEILLDLAYLFSDIPFVMVLNRSDPKIHAEVLRRKPENLRILERVDYRNVETLFAQAFVLINTSVFEGFPNTFLQAGKYGVPVLSLQIDPDGFIERHRCGIVAKGDSIGLIDGLKRIKTHPDLWQNYSRNIRSYVFNCHELNAKVIQLNQILSEFLRHGFENRSRIP